MTLHIIGTKALLRSLPPEKGYNRALVLDELKAKRLVSAGELIDRLYGDDPEGGPLCADVRVRVLVSELRTAGCVIKTVWGRGYMLTYADKARAA